MTLGHAEANFKDHDMNMDGFLDEPRAHQFNVQSRWLYYIPEIQVRWGVGAVYDSRKGGQTLADAIRKLGYEVEKVEPEKV